MTRRARRTIFYVLVALFPIIGAAVVFYAQGWRLDIQTWRFSKVGAILVRPYPSDAAITLDDEPVRNRAGLLSQSTLIGDLVPGNYTLTLTKTGYFKWTEDASVLPSLVTEFKYAVLVPNTPASVSTTSIKDFFVASGELVSKTANGNVQWRGETIAHGDIVSVSADLRTLVTRDPATGVYAVYDFSSGTTANLSAALASAGASLQNISDVAVDPWNDTLVIARGATRVWIYDTAAKIVTLAGRTPDGAAIAAAAAASANRIAWTTSVQNSAGTKSAPSLGSSSVVIYDPFAKTAATSTAMVPGSTKSLAWITGNTLGVLQSDGALYIYDINAQTFTKIADTVKDFSVAPDSSAIAALEEKSFELIPLADSQIYGRFNLPDPAHITGMIWYRDSGHLFIMYPGSVAFLDLTDTALKNLRTVAEGSHALYNADQNIFYLINPQGKLEAFDFPS